MNSSEHYKEAERLRDCARDFRAEKESAAYFNAAAQVHATLALVGAVMVAGQFHPDRPDEVALYRRTVQGSES